MAIKGNFTIGGRSFAAKKSGSASPKKNKIKEFKGGDSRGNYLTNQAFRQQQADDAAMQAALTNRASIKSSAGKGIINPSDFKGGSARLPGESGEDYRKFMVGLRGLNTDAFDKAFPFSSGAALRSASQFMPGGGVLSLLADIGSKIKGGFTRATDIFMPNSDEVVGGTNRPGPYDASGLAGYQDAIMKNLPPVTSTNPQDMGIAKALPGRSFVPNPSDMNIMPALAPNIFPETVTAPRRLTATDPAAAALMEQIMNKPINMVDGRDTVGDLQPMYGINAVTMNPEQYILDNPPEIKTGLFNEGGLASINNPEYNMLMKASNFDV